MPSSNTNGDASLQGILEQLQALESRISLLEGRIPADWMQDGTSPARGYVSPQNHFEGEEVSLGVDKSELESGIGEYGLAVIGSFVLVLGIAFLVGFVKNLGYPFYASLTGYLSVAGVFFLSWTLRSSFPYMVRLLRIGGHLLVYYITLQLYFFTTHPLIQNQWIDVSLLIVVSGAQFVLALRRKSEVLATISLLLLLLTALLADQAHVSLALIAVAAALALGMFLNSGWWRMPVIILVASYICHVLWIAGNPLAGHAFEMVPAHPYPVIYLFITGALFSVPALSERLVREPLKGINALVLLNGMFFSFVILLATLVFFSQGYTMLFGLITVFCMGYSIVLHSQTSNPFAPSFFACFGFMALSVTVYGFAGLPEVFFYLGLQSLIVVAMALWFRSRIIVIMNTVLFFMLLVVYLVSSPSVDRINFSFAIVAFATARIINWKRERLTLKTDLMRNLYLWTLFVMMLFSCYQAIPRNYVSISWTAVAILYFILSLALRNTKYRWMAMGTLLAAVIYLVVVDMAHLSLGYRVIAFLVLAVITLTASLLYAKYLRKKRELVPGTES